MKNTNKLFGRRLTKLFLTPVLSIGLVAGFAVTPASADFDPVLAPYAGQVAVVQTGNASSGFTFNWSAWLPAAPSFDNASSPEATFGARTVPFAIVACSNASVVITDCIGGFNVYNEVARTNFVGFLRDNTMVTGLNGVNSITVTKAGSASLLWSPDATGVDNNTTMPTSIPALQENAYKLYVYVTIPNSDLANNVGSARSVNANPYYASAPISVDFRPLSATPTISAQPASASKTVGDALSLSVVAAGAGTLSYQWKRGGTAISGATSATYSIPSVATGDAGSYTVDVINTESNKAPVTVTSNAAVVTVAAATASPSASSPSTGTSSTVAPVVTCKIAKGKKLAKTCLITASGSVVPKKAKVSLKVAKANKKVCKVQGTKIKALKPGTCTVSVKVKPKKGKTITKTTVVTVS